MATDIAANKKLAGRLYEEVFARGNLATADEILAPDCVSHGPGMPPRIGTDDIKRQAALLREAAPDLAVALEDQVAEGDRVASRWRAFGTHTGNLVLSTGGSLPPTGRRFEFSEIRIDRIAGGRIVESWFIPDRAGLMQQLSAPPAE
jgi:predicted ester cyclase